MLEIQSNSNSVPKNPIRPALIVDQETFSYFSDSLKHLLMGLADESMSSALICPADAAAKQVIGPFVEVIVHPVFNMPLLWVQNRKHLCSKLSKFNPTILHCLCESKLRLTKCIAEEFSIPYIANFDSITARLFKPPISSDYCGALIASSESVSAYLQKKYHNLTGRIEQINIGIFVNDKASCFSNPDRITSMLTVQPLNSLFHYEQLLNAIRHLAIDGYEFIYAIIGKGPAEKDIHELIKTLGLTQIVTVIPSIEPLRSIFSGADIYIHPFSSDRFNTHLLDAMGAGMAIAASRGGVEDSLIEGETGIFFEPEDELSIYNVLQKLLDKREFAKSLAYRAQQRLRQQHSVSKMVDSVISIYRNAQQWYKASRQ
jgi:glycosyltransferase involved in cell wall biosynthesis